MPRVRAFGVPQEQRELEEELRKRYGGMMTTHEISIELGKAHYNTTRSFMEGVPCRLVGKSKRYLSSDVAKRIYERTFSEESVFI